MTEHTEHRVVCIWPDGSFVSSLTPDFHAELQKMVELLGPPEKTEFRAHGEGWVEGGDHIDEDDNEDDKGWLQCNQCGHGHWVTRVEVEVGDYAERGGCPHCGIGITTIDWSLAT